MALTEEQRLRMEENRLKALARRQESQRAAGTVPATSRPAATTTTTPSSTLPGQFQGSRHPPPVLQSTSTPFQGSFF